MVVCDSLLAAALDVSVADQKDYYKNMFRTIIAAAIWIPYFNMSTRVKDTFVTRVIDDDDDMSYAEAGEDPNQSTVSSAHR